MRGELGNSTFHDILRLVIPFFRSQNERLGNEEFSRRITDLRNYNKEKDECKTPWKILIYTVKLHHIKITTNIKIRQDNHECLGYIAIGLLCSRYLSFLQTERCSSISPASEL